MENIRKISDMYLAAALLSYGVELVEIDRSDTHRQKFCFVNELDSIWVENGGIVTKVNNPSIEDVETKFTAKTLLFPPSYPDAIRRIKSAIHSG